MEAACVRQHAIEDAIIAAAARTPEGVAAKAAVLRATTEDCRTAEGYLQPHELLAVSLVNDLTAQAG